MIPECYVDESKEDADRRPTKMRLNSRDSARGPDNDGLRRTSSGEKHHDRKGAGRCKMLQLEWVEAAL